MKPEAAVVIALAAGNAKDLLAAIEAGPDWQKVEELAAFHQVDAICWWMLRNAVDPVDKSFSDKIPSLLLDRLRKGYLVQMIRNEALVADLTVLQEALAAYEVDGLYLKGPWMALHAYPDPAMRPVNDIDLCVREEQYTAAIVALQSVGWQSKESLPKTPAEALAHNHYRRQLRFFAEGRRLIELHFRLINMGPPAKDESWIWDSARKLPIGTATIQVPGPEAMFLHLLLHANQHGFAVLRLLHDIRWFFAQVQTELDAENFVLRVQELRCTSSCYHSLKLAEELADASVPETLLDALRSVPLRRALFSLVWRLQAVRRLEAPLRRTETESPLFYLLEMGRPKEKAYFISRIIAEVSGFYRLTEKTRRILSK